jgi:hypothetical protein
MAAISDYPVEEGTIRRIFNCTCSCSLVHYARPEPWTDSEPNLVQWAQGWPSNHALKVPECAVLKYVPRLGHSVPRLQVICYILTVFQIEGLPEYYYPLPFN